MTSWLTFADRGPIRWLTLANPGRRNAIPYDGWTDLREAFVDFDSSAQRVLVMTGAGEDFCAGADLGGGESGQSGGGETTGFASGDELGSVAARHRRMKLVGETVLALHRLSKPTVAAVDGVAAGAGMNLALGCDVVVATIRARFSEIFARRGFTLDSGGSWLLPRVVGTQRAKELALTGRLVGAAEAKEIGLVLEVVEPGDLAAAATKMAESFLAGAPIAQMLSKQALDRAWDLTFEEALSWEAQMQAIALGTDDAAEGLAAFLAKRPPDWKGR